MKPLGDRTTRELRIVAVLCYGAAAVILAGAAFVLATWHLRWPVVRNCAGVVVIAAAFIFAAVRNHRMARKRDAESAKPPVMNPD
jgi:hypothetical protein